MERKNATEELELWKEKQQQKAEEVSCHSAKFFAVLQ